MKVLTALFCLSLCSCALVNSLDRTSAPVTPHQEVAASEPDKDVEIVPYNDKRSYSIIGVVRHEARRGTSDDAAIKEIKRKAVAMGGDAIVDLDSSAANKAWQSRNGTTFNSPRTEWSAKVIVWKAAEK